MHRSSRSPGRARLAQLRHSGCIRLLVVLVVGTAVVLGVAPGAALAEDALHTLAKRYAPVVRLSEQLKPCAGGEAFEPIDVDTLFRRDDVVLRGPGRHAVVKVAPTASDLAGGRSGDALDFPGNALRSSACSYEKWQRRITAGRRPTVYAHVAIEDDKLALQYWLFYVYNDFNNKHEGDWELVQLDFDAATPAAALRTLPFELGYSQHRGAERADWDAAKLEVVGATHPVVYPAEGSHANYYSGALFLGRSAAQGVGCDDTNEPWQELRPDVAVIPRSPRGARAAFPWLGYEGRWGERRRGIYDAPTGPSTKEQWAAPITWANESWRAKSFALAGGRSLGPTATTFFCGAVSTASSALIHAEARPLASAAVVGALLLLVLWLASRTQGSLVTAAARVYAANLRLFVGIGAIFLVLGLVTAGAQYLLFRRSGLSSLVVGLGPSNALTETVVLALGFVVNLLGLAIVQATCACALLMLSERSGATAAEAYRATARRLRPLLGGLLLAALAVAVTDLTIVGLPIAIWLTIRWSLLAQAVALDDEDARGALGRSGRLVRGAWWRTAAFTVFVTGLALLLGPLAGTLLLFATNASFDVVNVASDLVYVVILPFAAVATTFLYVDLSARQAERSGRAGSST